MNIIRLLLIVIALGIAPLSVFSQTTVKLTEYEIERIETIVHDFYDCSNVIAEEGPTAGHCMERLTVNYFGYRSHCPINNDFFTQAEEDDGRYFYREDTNYFSNFNAYCRALRKSDVQMEVVSMAPRDGKWVKTLMPKYSESESDEYIVSICVHKRIIIKYENGNYRDTIAKEMLQTINLRLPDYTIIGIHSGK